MEFKTVPVEKCAPETSQLTPSPSSCNNPHPDGSPMGVFDPELLKKTPTAKEQFEAVVGLVPVPGVVLVPTVPVETSSGDAPGVENSAAEAVIGTEPEAVTVMT